MADVVVDNPNSQTVMFAGRFINLSEISRQNHIDVSYLSRIFRGQRTPSLPYIKKISRALDMSIEDFVNALDKVQA